MVQSGRRGDRMAVRDEHLAATLPRARRGVRRESAVQFLMACSHDRDVGTDGLGRAVSDVDVDGRRERGR
jgi:hypothetical protein